MEFVVTEQASIHLESELNRFSRRLRTSWMTWICEIHPRLDYDALLFLLAICDAKDGVRASELSKQFGVSRSTVSRAVAALGSLGLAQQIRESGDGRAKRVVPTVEALAKVDAFRRCSHERLGTILSGWNSDEIAAFVSGLARINEGSTL